MREQSIIRNPLTVIAIFAGIAEVSGTIVLPMLDPQLQTTFMWFVMGFPCALVALFFVTLFVKHEVLYAPSDYRDDASFLSARRKAQEAREEKLRDDLAFVAAEVESKAVAAQVPEQSQGHTATTHESLVADLKRTARGTYFLAEKLVLDRLEKEYVGNFSRESMIIDGSAVFAFDATVSNGGSMTAIEVKYLPAADFSRSILRNLLSRVDTFYKGMSASAKNGFRLVLAIATDAPEIEHVIITDRLASLAADFSTPFEIRVFGMKDLEAGLDER